MTGPLWSSDNSEKDQAGRYWTAMEPDPQAGQVDGVVRGVDGSGASKEAERAVWDGGGARPPRKPFHPGSHGGRAGGPRDPHQLPRRLQGAHDCCYATPRSGSRHPNITVTAARSTGCGASRGSAASARLRPCTQCYSATTSHDLAHASSATRRRNRARVTLSPRQGSQGSHKGHLPGGEGGSGPDWEWGSQDVEGKGKSGRVGGHPGWDVETGRSVASVTWADGNTKLPRGPQGQGGIKCVGRRRRLTTGSIIPRLAHSFWVGTWCVVIDDLDTVKRLQAGHGDGDSDMAPARPAPGGVGAQGVTAAASPGRWKQEPGRTALQWRPTSASRAGTTAAAGRGQAWNMADDEGNTALHYAPWIAHANNTPLHCAISGGSAASGIVEVLTEVPGIDITATNSQGSLSCTTRPSKDTRCEAVKKILARARQLVDAQKEDGFTALHWSALNNHGRWPGFSSRGRCDECSQTVLLHALAAWRAAGHVGLVAAAGGRGCSVNAEDGRGIRAARGTERHSCRPVGWGRGGTRGPAAACPGVLPAHPHQRLSTTQLQGLRPPGNAGVTAGAAVACFLALEGADLSYANHAAGARWTWATEGRVSKPCRDVPSASVSRGGLSGRQAGGVGPGTRLVISAPTPVTNLHVPAPSGPRPPSAWVSELALLVLFAPVPAPHGVRGVLAEDEEVHQVPGGHHQEAASRWQEVVSAAPHPARRGSWWRSSQSRYRQMEERLTAPSVSTATSAPRVPVRPRRVRACGAALSACPICASPSATASRSSVAPAPAGPPVPGQHLRPPLHTPIQFYKKIP
ncbi:E3 ubiquitin-protein ligase MIB2 [Camelus dromedarius]|uniref:E3 ubiquitin-protein ligase MIB2 n=1 Tax=Camelus dromedarius TaxID=9838 RepID=A0A5N4DDG6_CAMDR|nr:E3 ubiquitin-protein ligase MIB2 [Camelus dromedarius]